MKSFLAFWIVVMIIFGGLLWMDDYRNAHRCQGQCDSYSQMGQDCKKMCAKAKNCPHADDY